MRNEVPSRAAPTADFLVAPTLKLHHPSEVLGDPGLTVAERRAILADWASDARAVENAPWLRQLENGARISSERNLERVEKPRQRARQSCVPSS